MPSSIPGQRFLALDVFRGMTICFMIIVNTPGGPVSYAPLEHARWNGFTPTDLVFPSFLFAVGNAMSFVMAKWNTLKQSNMPPTILERIILVILVGLLLYAANHTMIFLTTFERIVLVVLSLLLLYALNQSN